MSNIAQPSHFTAKAKSNLFEIDGLILKVKNVDELLAELEMLGYIVKHGKNFG